MKSYLGLIPISARVHRRQNRLTLLCIIIAVFLVTAVFSMAEMGIRMEWARLAEKHGALSLSDVLGGSWGQIMLLTCGFLFLLILLAGVLMISSSLGSNVAQRTKFFGMMRCLGMSRRQIVRFVRLEALNWCKTAIPIGLVLGIAATWGLCGILKTFVGEEFSYIPVFRVSVIGILCGIIVGVVTVLLAARSPAKRAAKVSPIAAVSGSAEGGNFTHAANTLIFKIETALGVHHAVSAKKNLFLMTSSFALSIILFLSFSVLIEFVDYLMPQYSDAPDISISSGDGSNTVKRELITELGMMAGVKRVYGWQSCFDVQTNNGKVDLVAYDDFGLDCLKKDRMLERGSNLSAVYGDSRYALTTGGNLQIGDKIQIGKDELEIAGLLKYNVFSGDGGTDGTITLITSGETLQRLTGETDYSLVMIQTTQNATDEDVAAIHALVGDAYQFSDQRDQRTSGTYYAFVLCVYTFLAIIALVTVMNIVNSISMSVSARQRQYGAMRAVGMDGRQITKMIAAEAFTYSLSGCAVGCVLGLLANKGLYDVLIAKHFDYAVWSVPASALLLIVLFILTATALSFYAPSKRIGRMAVTETINEL